MRIGYVVADHGIPVFGNKGASVHVQALTRAFAGLGHEVEILATRVGERTSGLSAEVVKVRDRRSPLGTAQPDGTGRGWKQRAKERRYLALGRAMYREILDRHRRAPFDFLYERYSLWSDAGVRAASVLGIPCLVEINAPLVREQRTFRVLLLGAEAERIERQVLTRADLLLVVSRAIREYAISKGAPAERTVVVPNGVDVDHFNPGVPPARCAAPPGAFVIGFVGSLKEWHDIGTLLDAFRLLARDSGDVHLLIVGDGPLRPWIEGYVRGARLGGRVTLTGWTGYDEMPALLCRFDVAVAPYAWMEDFYFSPLKLYEYLAAGRATVASEIGQVRDVVIDGATGLLARPGDPVHLAEQIRRLRGDPGLREELGRRAASHARAHTWKSNAERMIGWAMGLAEAV